MFCTTPDSNITSESVQDTHGLALGEEADLEALNCLPAPNLI